MGRTPHIRRGLSIGAVVSLHVLVFAIFAAIHPPIMIDRSHDLVVDVFAPHLAPQSAAPPPISWVFDAPEDVVVPEPEIAIISQPGDPDAIVASGPGQVVPPRLDRRYPNTAPDVPYDLRGAAMGAVIMLHLLILPDGSVEDAKILKSSRNADLDRITLDYVRKNWRYLPPSMGGKPIEAWTTAFVRFATPRW